MPLTKEEKLQQEYAILEYKNNQLQKKIFELKRKKQDLKSKIKSLTESIKFLEKEKAEKSWQITCLNIVTFGIFKYCRNKKINKKIRKMQIKSKALRKEIIENTKIKRSLKNQTLKVATKLIKTLKNLLINSKEQTINVRTEIDQEVSQKLDAILEDQKFKTIVDTNSLSSLTPDSSGYNSEDEQPSSSSSQLSSKQNSKDSDLDDILKQAPAVTCEKSNYNDDDEIEVLLCSSCLEWLSTNILDQNLVKDLVASSLVKNCFRNNSEDEQPSSSSSQLSSKQNSKDSVVGFQSELSMIIEEDDEIEIISESEDDDISEQKNILLERRNSKDSGFGDELEQLVFDQKSVNSYHLVGFSNLVNNFHQKNEI